MIILNVEEEQQIKEVIVTQTEFKWLIPIPIMQLPVTKRDCKRVLCVSTFFYEALMRWKQGHQEYSERRCMKFIKVHVLHIIVDVT